MPGPRSVRLSPEDFPEAPAEMRATLEKLFTNLNPFISDTSSALDKRLTVSENLVSSFHTVDVTAPDWVAVASSGTTDPYFKNSWVNFGGAQDEAAYWIDDQAVLRLRGSVKDGTVGYATPIFTLPVGARPPSEPYFLVSGSGGGAVEVVVQLDGDVSVTTDPDTSAVARTSLDPVQVPLATAAPPFSGPGWPLNIKPGFSQKVVDVRVVKAVDLGTGNTNSVCAGACPDWNPSSKGLISIRRVGGLVPGRTYRLTLLLLGA